MIEKIKKGQPATSNKIQSINRRNFLKYLGGGLTVAILPPVTFSLFEKNRKKDFIRNLSSDDISGWLQVHEDNQVSVFTGKVEVGQNIRTSLAQMVSEELEIPFENIKMIMGDTDLVPYDRGTFGSRSTPQMGMQLKKAAATAKNMIKGLASEQWKIPQSELIIENGRVSIKNKKKSATFGEICKGADLIGAVQESIELTKPENWKIIGKSFSKVNGKDFVTGKHQFTSDIILPGMLYGKVLRPPAYGARLVSLNTSAADAIEGVKTVQDDGFVGVVADTLAKAEKALKALVPEWDTIAQPSKSEIFAYLKENASQGPSRGSYQSGDIENGLSSAEHRLSATYTVDYIAHAPMEPRAAVAQWEEGKLTVWTGTQRPFGVKEDLASKLKISQGNVRVIMPDTGGAFGGKHTGDAAVEAAILSKAAGKPVKLVWTREEEFVWAYFRPAGVIEVDSGLQKDGTISTWSFHNYNSGPAAINAPYEIPNKQSQFHPVDSPLRQGSYRGLASTANVFAIESHMNDLAETADIDPLEFRLKHLREPRLKAAFEAAAQSFGWGKANPLPDHGFGMGGGTDKGGYTATFAEVQVNRANGNVKVIRTVTAFECGAIINPEHLENQILGSIVQGLGGALFESIDFENGRILNPKFSQYRIPRFADMPKIEIVTINRLDLPSSGAGEAPIIGIAPAIRNAIAQATGVKLKTLPLAPKGLNLSMR